MLNESRGISEIIADNIECVRYMPIRKGSVRAPIVDIWTQNTVTEYPHDEN